MNRSLHSLFQPAFYHPFSTSLHPPRRALRTAFVAAVTITTIIAPAAWLLARI